MNLRKQYLKAVLIVCFFLVGSFLGERVLADGTSASVKTRATVTFYYGDRLLDKSTDLPKSPTPKKKVKILPQTGEKKELLMSLLGIGIILILFSKKKNLDINRKI